MRPLLIYLSILMVPVVISVLLRLYMKIVTRACPQCDGRVELGRRWCKQCGYSFDISRW